MSALDKMLVFHPVPDKFTVKMIKNQPSYKEWQQPFIQDPVTVKTVQAALFRGPFVAEAKLGPSFYVEKPRPFKKQIETHPDLPVYGWAQGAQRNSNADKEKVYQAVIVCGVQKQREKEHVYYVLATELSTDWETGIASYKTLPNKVYVTSVRTFSDSLYNMYPPAIKDETEQSEKLAALRHQSLQDKITALKEEINQGV